MPIHIHPTAIVEAGVHIGADTAIWDAVHIRHGARIGESCIIGEKTYIAYGVTIGNRVKINAGVYLCYGVTIEDGVMISAGTVFTNDRFPRATTPDLTALRPSEPDDETLRTRVEAGATIGANCTIGPGLRLGRFCMVGMGSVVTRSVPAHVLVLGNPARVHGYVCRCGRPLAPQAESGDYACPACGERYRRSGESVERVAEPQHSPDGHEPIGIEPSAGRVA